MMSDILDRRERHALEALRAAGLNFVSLEAMPRGIGRATLETLEQRGLVERAPGRNGSKSSRYRATADGWRCMFGKTYDDIRKLPSGVVPRPLSTWIWPRA
jgi:hypothetical protein